MNPQREILFEGLTESEILQLTREDIENLVLIGQPIVFRAGSAAILGSFRPNGQNLVVELAQIDGGGEGILLALSSLVRRYATQNQFASVEWIVHAVSCAKPNLKLRHVLQKRGFAVKDLPGIGCAYHHIERLEIDPMP